MNTKKLFGDHNSTVIIMTILITATFLFACYIFNVNISTLKLLFVSILLALYLTVFAYVKYHEWREKKDKARLEKLKDSYGKEGKHWGIAPDITSDEYLTMLQKEKEEKQNLN